MDPEIAKVFFSPNADVILLVADKRYPLKRVDGVAFAPNGSTLVAAEVPSEGVEAISRAESWDMAVGSLEAHYSKPQITTEISSRLLWPNTRKRANPQSKSVAALW